MVKPQKADGELVVIALAPLGDFTLAAFRCLVALMPDTKNHDMHVGA
jgi:hypothetical protein